MESPPRQGLPDGRAAAAHTPAAGRKNTRTVEGYHSDTYTKKPGAQRLSEGYTQPNDTAEEIDLPALKDINMGKLGETPASHTKEETDTGFTPGKGATDQHASHDRPAKILTKSCGKTPTLKLTIRKPCKGATDTTSSQRSTVYDGDAPDSAILKGYCDSDWTVGHSTTGYAIFLAGAVIGHSSKRQACIAASSTEAEVIAASSTSLEIVYFRRLLDELGLPQEGPTELYVDNTGAIALARDRRSCNRSRHIERRHLKVREYVAEDKIRVSYIASAENPSDVLTKTLSAEDHARHSRTLMGV